MRLERLNWLQLQRFNWLHYSYVFGGLLLCMASLVFQLDHWNDPGLAEESLSWPSVTGKISSSFVQARDFPMPHDDSDDDYETTSYSASVDYSYVVEGKEHHSSQVRYFVGPDAHETVRKYPSGAQVPVFYNPEDPSSAVLEPGTNTKTQVMRSLAIGFPLFFFTSLAAWVFAVRLSNRKRSQLAVLVKDELKTKGYQFREWTDDSFRSNLDSSEADPVFFSLVEEPCYSYDQEQCAIVIPPMGVATVDREQHLVVLHNDGKRTFMRDHLFEVRVELPWSFFGEGGEHGRKINLWESDSKRAFVLQYIYLGMRSDPNAQWRAEDWVEKPKRIVKIPKFKRRKPEAFDTGDDVFDGFFAQRIGSKEVRNAIRRVSSMGRLSDVVEPLKRWQDILHEVYIQDKVEVWIDLNKIRWEKLAIQLPLLADDVVLFAKRLENALGVEE